MAAHRAEHGGATSHVVLHQFHILTRLKRDTSGIEGDSLSHEGK